jgi:hypothetical protein
VVGRAIYGNGARTLIEQPLANEREQPPILQGLESQPGRIGRSP